MTGRVGILRGLPIVLALCSLPSFASGADQTLSLQRELYKDARQALTNKQPVEFQQALSLMGDYPLRPYLEYERLRQRLGSLSVSDLDAFATGYADTPLPGRLTWQWYNELIQAGRWEQYIKAYDPERASTGQQCHYLRALYRAGQQSAALKPVPELWTVGFSQPDACDPLFKAWIDGGHLTSERAYTRFWLAMTRGNTQLARYTTRFIQQRELRQKADLALRAQEDPQLLLSGSLPVKDGHYATLVKQAIKRQARKDAVAAIDLLKAVNQRRALPADLSADLKGYIGLRLIKGNYDEATTHLTRLNPPAEAQQLTEWRIRLALRERDWSRVLQLIEQLDADAQNNSRWRYWKARALEASGQTQESQALLSSVAAERTYYGFLAAERSNLPLQLNQQRLEGNDAIKAQLSNLPGLIRARELQWHGQMIEARREWNLFSRDFDKVQHYTAAQLADGWGWHAQAIRSTIDARFWDDLHLRFPVVHQQAIESQAEQHQIARYWVYAIARQESAFTSDARSSAGATGLMQLMPATARQTARRHQIPYSGPASLKNPELNIQLGSAYLAELYQQFDGNRVLATAAYNAGPHRVRRWTRDLPAALPVDIWVENIPFDETRQYVQNVLSFAAIYARLQGSEPPLLEPREAILLAEKD